MSRPTNPGLALAAGSQLGPREHEAIERAWGISLAFREEIRTATDNYLLAREAQNTSTELGDSRRLLTKLCKSLSRSAEILSTIHDNALAGDGTAITAFDALSVREPEGKHSLKNNLERLEAFRDQCQVLAEAAGEARGDLRGSSGPNPDDAFAGYLRSLGDIYRRGTHRRPWTNWDDASQSYGGRFQNGVATALNFIGENHSDIALGKAIKRALSGDGQGALR